MSVAHKLHDRKRTDDVLISETVDFSGLLLSKPVLQGLVEAGFQRPSPIQLKAIPLGRCGLDLIVQAKSGTGKTCVFTVVALESLDLAAVCIQVLVLAPTREIAQQIQDVVRTIGLPLNGLKCHTFIGGMPVLQDKILAKNCHIAVGTPGRIKQLIEIGALKTNSIRLFVLDEADKLLEGDFQQSINWIYSSLPENKQILALSATYPEYLAHHLTSYMRNPTFVRLNISDPALLGIKQYHIVVPSHPMPNIVFNSKTEAVMKILTCVSFQQCLIFSNMQTRAQNLQSELQSRNWPTACIAGCLDQKERNFAMEQLKTYRCRILISTDLTSRGIDADKVNLVINLDVPPDHETYLHRIGRAGRFGSYGAAVTIVSKGAQEKELWTVEKKCKTYIHKLPDPIPKDLVSKPLPVSIDDVVTTQQITNKPDGASGSALPESFSLDLCQEASSLPPDSCTTIHSAQSNSLSDTDLIQQESSVSYLSQQETSDYDILSSDSNACQVDNVTSTSGANMSELLVSVPSERRDHEVIELSGSASSGHPGEKVSQEDEKQRDLQPSAESITQVEKKQQELQGSAESATSVLCLDLCDKTESISCTTSDADAITSSSSFNSETVTSTECEVETSTSVVSKESLPLQSESLVVNPESQLLCEKLTSESVGQCDVADSDSRVDKTIASSVVSATNVQLAENRETVKINSEHDNLTASVINDGILGNGDDSDQDKFSCYPRSNSIIASAGNGDGTEYLQRVTAFADGISKKVLLDAFTAENPLHDTKTKAFQTIGVIPTSDKSEEIESDTAPACSILAKDETVNGSSVVEHSVGHDSESQESGRESDSAAVPRDTCGPSTISKAVKKYTSSDENLSQELKSKKNSSCINSTSVLVTSMENMGTNVQGLSLTNVDQAAPCKDSALDDGESSLINTQMNVLPSQNVSANVISPSVHERIAGSENIINCPPQEESTSVAEPDVENCSKLSPHTVAPTPKVDSETAPVTSPSNSSRVIAKSRRKRGQPRSLAVADFMRYVHEDTSSFTIPSVNNTSLELEDEPTDRSVTYSELSGNRNKKAAIDSLAGGDFIALDVIKKGQAEEETDGAGEENKGNIEILDVKEICDMNVKGGGDSVSISDSTNSASQHPTLVSSLHECGLESVNNVSDSSLSVTPSENHHPSDHLQEEVVRDEDCLGKSYTCQNEQTALDVKIESNEVSITEKAVSKQILKGERAQLTAVTNSLFLPRPGSKEVCKYKDLVKNHQEFCDKFEKKSPFDTVEVELLKLLVPLDFTCSTGLQDLCAFEIEKLTELKSRFQNKLEAAEKIQRETPDSEPSKETSDENVKKSGYRQNKQQQHSEKYKAPKGRSAQRDSFEEELLQYQRARQNANAGKHEEKDSSGSKPSDSLNWRRNHATEISGEDQSYQGSDAHTQGKRKPGKKILKFSDAGQPGYGGGDSDLRQGSSEPSLNQKQSSAGKSVKGKTDKLETSVKKVSQKEQSRKEIQQLDDMHEQMLKRRQEKKAEKLRLQRQNLNDDSETSKSTRAAGAAGEGPVDSMPPPVELLKHVDPRSSEDITRGKQEIAQEHLKQPYGSSKEISDLDSQSSVTEKFVNEAIDDFPSRASEGPLMDVSSKMDTGNWGKKMISGSSIKVNSEKAQGENSNITPRLGLGRKKVDELSTEENKDKLLKDNMNGSVTKTHESNLVKKSMKELPSQASKEKQIDTKIDADKECHKTSLVPGKDRAPSELTNDRKQLNGSIMKMSYWTKPTGSHKKPHKPSKTEARLAGIEVSEGSTSSTTSDLTLSSTSELSDVNLSDLDKSASMESQCYANKYASDEGHIPKCHKSPQKKNKEKIENVSTDQGKQQPSPKVYSTFDSENVHPREITPGHSSLPDLSLQNGSPAVSMKSGSRPYFSDSWHSKVQNSHAPSALIENVKESQCSPPVENVQSRKKYKQSRKRLELEELSSPFDKQFREAGEKQMRRHRQSLEKKNGNKSKEQDSCGRKSKANTKVVPHNDQLSDESSGSESEDEDSSAQPPVHSAHLFPAHNQSYGHPYHHPQFSGYPFSATHSRPTYPFMNPMPPRPFPYAYPCQPYNSAWSPYTSLDPPYFPPPQMPPQPYLYPLFYPGHVPIPYNYHPAGQPYQHYFPPSVPQCLSPEMSMFTTSMQLDYVSHMTKELSRLHKKFRHH